MSGPAGGDETYEEWAAGCLTAVTEGDTDTLYAHLDRAATDDLHALYLAAEKLALLARREWMHRTVRPSGGEPCPSS